MHGKRVGLKIIRQRYYCRGCQRTFADQLFEVDETRQMTLRSIRYICQMCFKTTNTAVAWMVGVDESTILSIFREHMAELATSHIIDTPRWLGLD
jgi:transposase